MSYRWSENPWLEKKIQERVDFREGIEQGMANSGKGGASLDDIKALVNGDDFFRGRLPMMANDVRNGDYTYMTQNYATSGDNARDIVSAYSSLLDSGHTNAEIMSHIYGGDGSDYSSWDTNPPNKTSHGEYVNPEDDPDGVTPNGPNGNQGGNSGGYQWDGSNIGQSGSAWGPKNVNTGGQGQVAQQGRMSQPPSGGMMSGMQGLGQRPQVKGGEKPQGYSLFSPDNEQMRSFISKNLKNRLFG